MRTVAIVQARMSSSRLPGKVLADIYGRPAVWHTATRARAAEGIDEVVVATSTDASDDPVAATCREAGIPVYRGSLADVLGRFHGAAVAHRAELVVRLTADCPMLDPEITAQVCRFFDPDLHDYVSNTAVRTFPNGLDTEVFSFESLERAFREASTPLEREHVTPYMWLDPDRFRWGSVEQQEDHSSCRWTLDFPEDLEFVRAVFEGLGRLNFGQRDALQLLAERPEIERINGSIGTHMGHAELRARVRAGGERS